MKKLVKILAAMSVAVATFAFVSCVDSVGQDFKFPEIKEPETPTEAPKDGTYYLNWSISNLDDYEDLMTYYDAAPNVMTTISREVTEIPAAEEGEDPTYRVTYKIGGSSYYSIKQWKALYDVDIVDNTKSIDITSTGYTFTYKPAAELKVGNYNMISRTENLLGSSVAAAKTTTLTSTDTDQTKWNAISDDKTAEITVGIAATETTPAKLNIEWGSFDDLQEEFEGDVVFSVDGDKISFTMVKFVDTDNNGSTDTPAVYTYVFEKE